MNGVGYAVPSANNILAKRRSGFAAKQWFATRTEIASQCQRSFLGGRGRGIRYSAFLRAAAGSVRDRIADRHHTWAARPGRRQNALRIIQWAVQFKRVQICPRGLGSTSPRETIAGQNPRTEPTRALTGRDAGRGLCSDAALPSKCLCRYSSQVC